MKLILFVLLALLPTLALAGEFTVDDGIKAPKAQAYHADPQHPGRHYDCTKGAAIAYENSDIIATCADWKYAKTRKHFWSRAQYRIETGPATQIWVKGPVNAPEARSQAELDAVVLSNFQDPFYDSSEKRQVRALGWAIAADVVTTGIGIKFGGCSEVNPIMRHAPVLGTALIAYKFFDVRATAKRTPRVLTVGREALPWAYTARHGLAAANNLRCVL